MSGIVGSSFIPVSDEAKAKMNARHPSDFYPTPYGLAHALVRYVKYRNSDWGPGQEICIGDIGAGSGRFGRALRHEFPLAAIAAFEVQYEQLPAKLGEEIYDCNYGDFMDRSKGDGEGQFDLLIGNPPFSLYSRKGFWDTLFWRCAPGGRVFLLGQSRLNYSTERASGVWLEKQEIAEIILSKRPSWYPEGHPRCGHTQPTEYSAYLLHNEKKYTSMVDKLRWTGLDYQNDNTYDGIFKGLDTWQMMQEMQLHDPQDSAASADD